MNVHVPLGGNINQGQNIYETVLDWPRSNVAWVVISINLFLIIVATLLPSYMDYWPISFWFSSDPAWTGQQVDLVAKHATCVTGAWLLAANLISFLSLFLLNFRSGDQAGTLSDLATAESAPSVRGFDRMLAVVRVLSYVMLFLLLIAMLFLLLVGSRLQWLHGITWFTGIVYIVYMLVNDGFAARAFTHCSQIQADESNINSLNETQRIHLTNYKIKLWCTKRDLSVYKKLIYFVDLPILIGLIPIYSQKVLIMPDSLYKEGFISGSIAMHVIAANLISIAIDLVQYREVR